ncbi:MAG: hypothetical protein GX125_02020 [Bacteroidales bacterium]|jgi:hypothetical protein|nr:hypothetical protein [Bacteroidota bacterium]NLN99035.1 hypothetical protein [Bacteroidales bacterium]
MKTLLEVTIDDQMHARFHCPSEPSDDIELFNEAFVSFLFYPDIPKMEQAVHAVRLLAMAEVCACMQPMQTLAFIHREAENLIPIARMAIQELNKRLASQGAVIK